MSTILKVRGADFSKHCLNVNSIQLENGGINIRVEDRLNYGLNTIGSGNSVILRTINNIFIKSGGYISISGLKGINGEKEALSVDWCAYSINERTHEDVITTASKGVSSMYYYINKEEKLDTVKIINDTGSDAYFGFIFKGDGSNLNPADYSPLRAVIINTNV